jgi:hypothetical protein
MSSKRDRYGNPMYGAVHKAERKRFAARMGMGEVFYCWRPTCSRPNEPIDPRRRDLGHVDPELRRQFGMRWPEHPACNRATLTHAKAANGGSAEAKVDRFDGLPDPNPGNTVDRWSRHWSGGFDPRCPVCRAQRSPCEVALRNEGLEEHRTDD